MKALRRMLCLLLTFLLFFTSTCFAMTQDEWNRSCNNKTSCSTTVYVIGTYDTVKEIIPANTYLQVEESIGNNMKKVSYMIGGVKRRGKISDSVIIRCSSQYRGSNGLAYGVHELDPKHDALLESHLVSYIAPSLLAEGNKDYSHLEFELPEGAAAQAAKAAAGNSQNSEDRLATQSTSDTSKQTTGSKNTNSKSNSSTAKPTSTAKAASAPSASSDGVEIKIEQLGTQTTKVSYQGKIVEVPTSELKFGTEVQDDKYVASIYAPKTGKASLRTKASTSAPAAKQCKAGTIVNVIEYGDKFCKIIYDGSAGYLLTSCLKFYDNDQAPTTGALSYNGKTNGSTTINIRNAAYADAAKIGTWKTGTEVLVFGHEDGWYEIEANGKRGFVMDEFLTTQSE